MLVEVKDKNEIERFLAHNAALNIYSIGDLDDFFWPYTRWYGIRRNNKLESLAMLYSSGASACTLLAFSEPVDAGCRLLEQMTPHLPLSFYAHLSPGLEKALCQNFSADFHGNHQKMFLNKLLIDPDLDLTRATLLSKTDLPAIMKLYQESYPGNWFDPRMLESDRYFGIFSGDELISIAGIHVYSKKYRVAALGNITTHINHRGKGLGSLVTTKLCQALVYDGLSIGLNVKSDNAKAISCYEKIGFRKVADYREYNFQRKQ
ncbi:MAG: GNAT family N-acetyltransferase [Candidatus Rifleibacteriota bacterium]